MRYFEVVSDGYINGVGTGAMGKEITEGRYNDILSVLPLKPPHTATTDYRLREDLTWEEYEVEPPDPDPEIDDAEVYAILFGGAE